MFTRKLRKRDIFIYLASVMVLAMYIMTDPYFGYIQQLPVGAGTVATLLILLKGLLYVSLLHFTRKFVFDYEEADFQSLARKAGETPQGAGFALIGFSIMMVAFAVVIYAATVG